MDDGSQDPNVPQARPLLRPFSGQRQGEQGPLKLGGRRLARSPHLPSVTRPHPAPDASVPVEGSSVVAAPAPAPAPSTAATLPRTDVESRRDDVDTVSEVEAATSSPIESDAATQLALHDDLVADSAERVQSAGKFVDEDSGADGDDFDRPTLESDDVSLELQLSEAPSPADQPEADFDATLERDIGPDHATDEEVAIPAPTPVASALDVSTLTRDGWRDDSRAFAYNVDDSLTYGVQRADADAVTSSLEKVDASFDASVDASLDAAVPLTNPSSEDSTSASAYDAHVDAERVTPVESSFDAALDSSFDSAFAATGGDAGEATVDAAFDAHGDATANASDDFATEVHNEAKYDAENEAKYDAQYGEPYDAPIDAQDDASVAAQFDAPVDETVESQFDAQHDAQSDAQQDVRQDARQDARQNAPVSTQFDQLVVAAFETNDASIEAQAAQSTDLTENESMVEFVSAPSHDEDREMQLHALAEDVTAEWEIPTPHASNAGTANEAPSAEGVAERVAGADVDATRDEQLETARAFASDSPSEGVSEYASEYASELTNDFTHDFTSDFANELAHELANSVAGDVTSELASEPASEPAIDSALASAPASDITGQVEYEDTSHESSDLASEPRIVAASDAFVIDDSAYAVDDEEVLGSGAYAATATNAWGVAPTLPGALDESAFNETALNESAVVDFVSADEDVATPAWEPEVLVQPSARYEAPALLDAELAGFALRPGESVADPAPIPGMDQMLAIAGVEGESDVAVATPLVEDVGRGAPSASVGDADADPQAGERASSALETAKRANATDREEGLGAMDDFQEAPRGATPLEALASLLAPGERELRDFVQQSESQAHVLATLEMVARRVRGGEIVPSIDAGATPEAVLANVLAAILSSRT